MRFCFWAVPLVYRHYHEIDGEDEKEFTDLIDGEERRTEQEAEWATNVAEKGYQRVSDDHGRLALEHVLVVDVDNGMVGPRISNVDSGRLDGEVVGDDWLRDGIAVDGVLTIRLTLASVLEAVDVIELLLCLTWAVICDSA